MAGRDKGEGEGEVQGSGSEAFWERHYQGSSPVTSGRPSAMLARFADGLPPGRALDLGCAKGDDAVWLARQGWRVVAVDVSETVLGHARKNARAAGVEGRIDLQRHDLGRSFPDGAFDLVSAQYLESPVEAFPRARVLRAAAAAVAPGGLLLVVAHGSAAPWSWGDPHRAFPTPEEALAHLALDLEAWKRVAVASPERQATGPGGQTATVRDTVLALRRNSRSP